MGTKVCFTFDLEEWFQVENLRSVISSDTWEKQAQRVETSTKLILESLEASAVKATFFVLGWVANKNPAMVRRIAEQGHEISSHGYAHDLCYNLDRKALKEDIARSKMLLEDITGKRVIGYRAPCFSVTDDLLEILAELGFGYDSSLHVSRHARYGKLDGHSEGKPFRHRSGIIEFPLPVVNCKLVNIPVSGGGYFRLFPYYVFQRLVEKYVSQNDLYVFYIHPWETDPAQPVVDNIPLKYRIRHYIGLSTALHKLNAMLKKYGGHAVRMDSVYLDMERNAGEQNG